MTFTTLLHWKTFIFQFILKFYRLTEDDLYIQGEYSN